MTTWESTSVKFFYLDDEAQRSEFEKHLAPLPLAQYLFQELTNPARGRFQARFAIVETNHTDRDFNIAYARFYARSFRNYGRSVFRAHFFSERVGPDDISNEERLQALYLGYLTLYPGPIRRVGRSVLRPVTTTGHTAFVLCQGRYTVNLLGARLEVEGVPFIEQDGRVAACASAAIWTASRAIPKVELMGENLYGDEGLRTVSLAEITDLATRYTLGRYGDPLLSPGLTVEQILLALRDVGYSPIAYGAESLEEEEEEEEEDSVSRARRLVYCYVESQISPILVLLLPKLGGLHAITVVGHTYNPSGSLPKAPGPSIGSDHWCPTFLFHDDQHGPYLEFQFRDPAPASEGMPTVAVQVSDLARKAFDYPDEGIDKFFEDATLQYIIIPMPPRIFLLAEDAECKGKILLQEAHIQHHVGLPATPIYRTYLTRSNALKRRFFAGNIVGLSPKLAQLYGALRMSRFVWVVEMCQMGDSDSEGAPHLEVVAEAVLDATSGPGELDFIGLHIPKMFMSMPEPGTSASGAIRKPVPIEDDSAYQVLARPAAPKGS